MTHRDQQKQATRRTLVSKALRLCARHGFGPIRTADVARAAGLSHGAAFVHFPTRESLLDEVLSTFARTLTDALHDRVASGAGLKASLTAHLVVLAEHEALYRSFLLEGPAFGQAFRVGWTGIQSAASAHLAEAVTSEERVKPMPHHLLFNTWIGLVNHYVLHRDLFAPGRSSLATHGPVPIDHFMQLITYERTL
jgi:AcrR family transcriptional regulator